MLEVSAERLLPFYGPVCLMILMVRMERISSLGTHQ